MKENGTINTEEFEQTKKELQIQYTLYQNLKKHSHVHFTKAQTEQLKAQIFLLLDIT